MKLEPSTFPRTSTTTSAVSFEYCKLAGVKVIVAGDAAIQTLPRIEKFVKEYDVRFAIHNHGPEDKIWASPLTVLDAVKNMDPPMGCCIDVGTPYGPAPMSSRPSARQDHVFSMAT